MATQRLCSIPGCGNCVKGHDLCAGHLYRRRRYGPDFDRSPLASVTRRGVVCTIEGCGLPHKTRGYCVAHYTRWQRAGDNFDRSPIVYKEESGTELIERVLLSATPEHCIEWPYGRSRRGYGTLTIDGRPLRAHREMCRRAHGEPPDESYLACHSCDNPPCFNPHHLSWKTHQGNIDDRTERNRGLKGEAHHKAKLREADIPQIRARIAAGDSDTAIANDYGVTGGSIWFIRAGRHWRHVA